MRARECMCESDVRAGCVPNAPVTLSLRTNRKWEMCFVIVINVVLSYETVGFLVVK